MPPKLTPAFSRGVLRLSPPSKKIRTQTQRHALSGLDVDTTAAMPPKAVMLSPSTVS